MKRTHVPVLVVVVLALGMGARACAGEMKMELDSATEPKLFSRFFGRYGYEPMKTITSDIKGGVRFQLPSGTKHISQTGLYSFFALAGDFEISASYEWTKVTAPRDGYGVSCGIAIEIEGILPVGHLRSLSLARCHMPDKGEGYLVVYDVITQDRPRWEHEHFPIRAKRGKLAMRREKDEVILLVGDSPQEELRELTRKKFPQATVRKTRLFADQGRSMTYLDAKLADFRVRAEEITGGMPRRDQQFAWSWWLTYGGLGLVSTILFILFRREKRQEYEQTHPEPVKKTG